MGETIGIGELQDLLAGAYGKTGGREILVQALRTGELAATCEEFIGKNPSAYDTDRYPDHAREFALPAGFWAGDWSHDGERTNLPVGQWDPFIYFTDWAHGDFSRVASYGKGHVQQIRRADGVNIDEDEAVDFLAAHGLVRTFRLPFKKPPSERQWLRWTEAQADYLEVSEKDLIKRAEAYFPDRKISRQMIRDWRGPQPKGRKAGL